MTSQEGKLFLQHCLEMCGYESSIDDLIIYKYGNRKTASEYNHDVIPTSVSKEEFRNHRQAKYVVKCLCHDEVYIAWTIGTGKGNGRYPVFKNRICDYLNNSENIKRILVLKNENAIIFKRTDKNGIEFIRDYLLRQ